ncbi:MAG: TRAP transporter substrate-binding protein [Actinobacteria bacterium]|nr:TRAP transporter substrate-binding protein [Actinomycetota bacterium]
MKNLFKTKWLSIILLVILGVCAFSIGGFSQEEKIILKFGHCHTVGSILDKTAHKFSEIVKEKSNDRVEVDIFPGAQLGQEKEAAEGVLMGSLQISFITPAFFQDIAKGFGLDLLPFVFKDNDQVSMVFNESPIGEELNRRLIEKGARVLGWIPLGMRQMIFVDKDIKKIEQFKGLKMRSPENEIWVEMYRAFGSRPTTITWGECYTALQTGVVEGMCSPLTSLIDMKFAEVVKYCLLTSHMTGEMIMIINEKTFQGLPNDIQKIIIEASHEATVYGSELTREAEREVITTLKEQYGIKFSEPTEEDYVKFKEAVIPMVDKWAKEHDCVDLLESIRKLTK